MFANRIYVQSGIHDAFVERLSKPVSEMKVGNGMHLDTVLGPLIRQVMAKFNAHISDAVEKEQGSSPEVRHTPSVAHSSSPRSSWA
jgi:acyl-CoA reductase-like NAD-dependent aldehyde dehydrogenase